MTDDTRDIENALRELRPRALSPALNAAIARGMADVKETKRNTIIPFLAWTTPIAAAAAVAWTVLSPTDTSSTQALPGLRLVRAEQAPTEIALLEPVKLDDGTFARPMRMRWSNAAQYRDVQAGAELIRYAPHDEIIGLVPIETY
jgi:hypothetical protein